MILNNLPKSISVTEEDFLIIVGNDTKTARERALKVLGDLEEGIKVFCDINDSIEIIISNNMEESERDIRLMQDMVDDIEGALSDAEYSKDASILMRLAISGLKLAGEVGGRDFDRTGIRDYTCTCKS